MVRQGILCLALASGASGVSADIVNGAILRQSGDGHFVKLDPSTAFVVGADTFDTDHLYGFDEAQGATLPATVAVDIGGADGLIAAGTEVSSHYVFFDSLNGVHFGTVYFDAPILGVAAFENTMRATDFLGSETVTYISLDLRGLEDGDQVWIDEQDPQRLWVYWAGSSPGDYIRVLTGQSLNPLMM